MQTISFSNRNAFLGLGTVSIFLLAYFAQVFLAAIFKIIRMMSGDKCIKDKVNQYLIDGLFFNTILTITTECFLEFIIYGFLNIYTLDISTNGEVLGLIFAFICVFLVAFLISVLIWSTAFKNETQIASQEF